MGDRAVTNDGKVTFSCHPRTSRVMTQDEYESYDPLEDHFLGDEDVAAYLDDDIGRE